MTTEIDSHCGLAKLDAEIPEERQMYMAQHTRAHTWIDGGCMQGGAHDAGRIGAAAIVFLDQQTGDISKHSRLTAGPPTTPWRQSRSEAQHAWSSD